MPSLQVKELPEAIYEKLKQAAKNEHRTLSQQAVVTLAKGLDIQIDQVNRRQKVLEEIKQYQIEENIKDINNPVNLIREDRER